MKKITLFLYSLIFISIINCSGSQKEDIIKIAVAGPMTGDNAEYGIGFRNASELMAEKYNASGGVLGRKIVIESFDDKNSAEEALSIAQKIVSDSRFVGVIGHFISGVCMVASPIYQSSKLINISPSASHPDFSKEGDYIFRNNTVIVAEAREGIRLALDVLKKTNIGILSIRTDWGTTAAEITKNVASEFGAKVVAHEEVIEGSDDYMPSISKLNNAGADIVIVVGMYNTLAPFARQYRALNPNIAIIGFSNAYSEQLIELGGDAVEGTLFPASFFHASDREDIKSFVQEYETKYKSIPSSLTAQAYDSVGILLEAIKSADSLNREDIKEQMYKISYDGVTGLTTFDEIGDAKKVYTIVKIENGQFVEMGQ